jgi:hypothetical protein
MRSVLFLVIVLAVSSLAADLTVKTNHTTDYVWRYRDFSVPLASASAWVDLPRVATTDVPCPLVATGVYGCLSGPCYDTVFRRVFPSGIVAILNVTANQGNTLGATLFLESSGVHWA